ncbi:hypothetical protein [Neorhizobium sp. DT-125]|uniref:hypothetical protein n=1 Tax=Neorhizobium sp. DT-125 TaxID=3396163 RepID=UPI003F1C418E
MLKKLLLVLGFVSRRSSVTRSGVVGVFLAMSPLLIAAGVAESAEPDVEALPLAEICLLPENVAGNTCAAFFLDKNGYQICLKDDMSGKIRCSGTFSTDEGDEEEAKPTGAPSDDRKI